MGFLPPPPHQPEASEVRIRCWWCGRYFWRPLYDQRLPHHLRDEDDTAKQPCVG